MAHVYVLVLVCHRFRTLTKVCTFRGHAVTKPSTKGKVIATTERMVLRAETSITITQICVKKRKTRQMWVCSWLATRERSDYFDFLFAVEIKVASQHNCVNRHWLVVSSSPINTSTQMSNIVCFVFHDKKRKSKLHWPFTYKPTNLGYAAQTG